MESSTQCREPLSHRSLQDQLPRSTSLNAIAPRRHSGFFTAFYNSLNTVREPDRASRRASTLVTTRDTDSYLESFTDDSADMERVDEEHDDDEEDIPPVPKIPPKFGRQAQGQFTRRPVPNRLPPPISYDTLNRGADPSQVESMRHPGRSSSIHLVAEYGPVQNSAPVPFEEAKRGANPSSVGSMGHFERSHSNPTMAGFGPVQNRAPVSFEAVKRGANPFQIVDTVHPDPLRSNPTVAGSGLTVSASHSDLSRPSRNVGRSRGGRLASASQIPTTLRPSRSGLSNIPHRDSILVRPPGSSMQQSHSYANTQPRKQENIPPFQNVDHDVLFAAVDHHFRQRSAMVSEKSPSKQTSIGSKQPSPREQRSMLGLRQNVDRKSDMPSPKKSPSGILNLDQVAQGAIPISRDPQPMNISSDVAMASQTDLHQYGQPQPEIPVLSSPIVKKKKSLFSLKKTADDTHKLNKKQSQHTKLEYGTSADESASRDYYASDPIISESIPRSFDSFDTNSSKATPKPGRSFFGFRKTSSNQLQLLPTPWITSQSQEDDHSVSSPNSPILIAMIAPSQVRYVSEPIMPSQIQQNPHRLMGMVSPTRHQGRAQRGMPKSRTTGMLSNLTSSFSRSKSNLANDSNTSLASYGRTAEPTTHVSNASATAEQLTFGSSLEHVSEAMGSGYWLGRFSSLNDRYRNEMLMVTINNPNILRSYQDTTQAFDFRARETNPQKAEEREAYEPATKGMRLIIDDEDRRAFRAFDHLKGTCVNDEAANDLWKWQQNVARTEGKTHWLPPGGTMEDKPPPGYVTRIVRGFTGRKDNEISGTQTAAGRRTNLAASVTNVFGKRSQTSAKERDRK